MNTNGKIALLVLGILAIIAICCFLGVKVIKQFVAAMRQAKAAEATRLAQYRSQFLDGMTARPAIRQALAPVWVSVKTPGLSSTRRLLSSTPRLRSGATSGAADRDPSRKTHFGYETVTEAEKQERVAGVFTSVAESYDRMNDLMSFGWHRVWKDHFVSSLNPGFSPLSSDPSPLGRPQHILDIAGGTGDIAFRILRHAHVLNDNPSVRVTISDINPAMLAVGKQRSESLPASQQEALTFLEANAEDLSRTKRLRPDTSFADSADDAGTSGIPDNSVDLYTVAFGIRNFSNIPAALLEARRVLRPGGVFACLEFAKADAYPLLDAAYRRWSFSAIPLIGQLVAADRDSYQYLVESIDRFPRQERFRDMIADAGFAVAGRGWEDLTGGIAAIHKGMKPRA